MSMPRNARPRRETDTPPAISHLNSPDCMQDHLAEVLGDLEAAGDAMRFVDAKGRIAWKATPRLRDYLQDLELEAEEDLEEL
jgi:hypothetical protein